MLLPLTLDRFLAIVFPFQYKSLVNKETSRAFSGTVYINKRSGTLYILTYDQVRFRVIPKISLHTFIVKIFGDNVMTKYGKCIISPWSRVSLLAFTLISHKFEHAINYSSDP